jgi:hypothetical protein
MAIISFVLFPSKQTLMNAKTEGDVQQMQIVLTRQDLIFVNVNKAIRGTGKYAQVYDTRW